MLYLAAESGTNPLIPSTVELVFGALAFVVVVGVLGKILLPRLQKTLDERTDQIEGGLQRAQETQAEADQALAQYRAQLAEARQEAAHAANEFGSDPQWLAAVGQLFLDRSQPRDAIPYLAGALKAQPSLDKFRRQLARAEMQSHDPQAVLNTIARPASAEDYYLRASAFYALHRLVKADEACRQALAKAPREPRYILLRARIRQLVGQHESALKLLREVTRLAPQWSEPYYSAGVSYYLQRRYAEARPPLERAVGLAPHDPTSLSNLATVLRESDRYGVVMLSVRDVGTVPDELRRPDGLNRYRMRNAEEYATTAQLETEAAIVGRARTTGAAAVSGPAVVRRVR